MKEEYRAKDGRIYTIDIDESGEDISVTLDRVSVGEIVLRLVEGAGRGDPDTYHITSLSLENCKRLGIGRQCLILHRRMFGAPLTAGSDNGLKSDDGSHLTGDGPGFIRKMREELLVEPSAYEDYDRFTDD